MAPRSQLLPIALKGWPKGAAIDKALDQIDVDEARVIIDAFPDFAPDMRRRGATKSVSSLQVAGKAAYNIGWAKTPDGKVRVGILNGSPGINQLTVVADNLGSFVGSFTFSVAWDPSRYYISHFQPALNGGAWIGISDTTNVGAGIQRLLYWRGAGLANYNPANVTATRGSTAVTGVGTTFSTTVEPGMFLFTSGGARFVGVVKSIQSNTALTLEAPALVAIAAAGARFTSYRGFGARVGDGLITVASGSVDVTGSNTKFQDQGLATGTWEIFKQSDYTYIGTVTSVTNNQALALTAGAAIAMNDDAYFAIKTTVDIQDDISSANTDLNKPGFITAVYAGRQWYANRSRSPDQGGGFVDRLWFSDPADMEIVNFNAGGTYFTPGGDKEGAEGIRALVPTAQALVALKHKEGFAVFGDSPDTFEVKRISTDGALSPSAATSYKDGAVWAGRQGIYLWDGADATNLLADTNQNWYTNLIKTKTTTNLRAWATVKRDYFFLTFIDVAGTQLTAPITGVQPAEYMRDNVVIGIHIPSKAMFQLSNLPFRGSIEAPHSTGDLWWYPVNEQENLISNSSFEIDAAAWNATGGASIARDSTKSFVGGASLKTTVDALGEGVTTTSRQGTLGVSVGDSVYASIRVWCSTDSIASIRLNIEERNALDALLTQSAGTLYSLKQGWNTLTHTYTLANAAVDRIRLKAALSADPTGPSDLYFDYAELYNLTDQYFTWYLNDWFAVLDGNPDFSVNDEHPYEREVIGPYLYIETGGLTDNDPTLKKRWRDILMHYLSWPGKLITAVGTGLSDDKSLESVGPIIPAATDWDKTKARFMKQDQVLRFVIMQENRNHSDVKIGPAEVGYKQRRRGVI